MSEAASKTAIRILRVAILSSIFSTLLFHHTFQNTWIITNDDYESMLAPHLRSDYNRAIIDKEGLSACLLVNDENPRLPEWLAYHYHVLPLRSIIVAVDPASRYRPNEILKRWVPMGMEVDIWEDVDYLGHRGGVCTSTVFEECLRRHRWRQTTFMARCMAELKNRNKTWTLLIDVDEYISSDALDWGPNAYNGAEPPPNDFPDFDKHPTIHDILKHKGETKPCFPFTRQLYGAKEDYNHTYWKDMAPYGFDDADFVTLKYRWRALKNKVFVNRWQKTIIDVSRIPTNDLVRSFGMTVHLPLPKHCDADPRKFRTTLLRANHYVDSFESYSYRKDARSHEKENFEKWEIKSKGATDEMDMDLTPWLKGFVTSVGKQTAKKLLHETGVFVKKEIEGRHNIMTGTSN